MAEELHKNAVITGCVNAFCLACESYFETKEEANCHIESSTHWRKLTLVPYLEKYSDHNIRKVKAGYFCEFCNELLLTSMKVDLHIAKADHKQNRGTGLLKPLEHGIVAFNNVHVQENAWHGLIDDVCSLCDAEVDNESHHKKKSSHILNLIRKPVKFYTNDAIYRQTDDKTIQCLTCNILLSLKTMNTHFADTDHLDRYANCKIKTVNVSIVCDVAYTNATNGQVSSEMLTDPTDNAIQDDNPPMSKELNVSKILSCLFQCQRNDIDVNFETDAAFCRKCCVDIQFDYNCIQEHIGEHSKTAWVQSKTRYPTNADNIPYCVKPTKNEIPNADDPNDNSESNILSDIENLQIHSISHVQNGDQNGAINEPTAEMDKANLEINNGKCDSANAQVFAKENHLTYNEQNGNAFCRICRVRLPSTLKSMREHVKGNKHNKKLTALKSEVKPNALRKQNMKQFVYSARNLFPEHCVVNGRYCLHQLSFYLITKNERGLRCLLCETNIYYSPPFYKFEVEDHVNNTCHDANMEVMPVITSEPSEFIREIRPDTFHCGFCNLVLSSWTEMENHLKCSDHIRNKRSKTELLNREILQRMMAPFRRAYF